MSSAVRLWRTAFLTLRDETFGSPPCSTVLRLLDQLIFSQFDALISAAADLPPQEVLSDLILLMELASNIFRSGETQDVTLPFTKLSHLFHGVIYSASLDFGSTSRILVIDTFGRIVELFLGQDKSMNALIVNLAVIKAIKQCLESVRLLFYPSFNTASQSENEKLLNFLLQVVGYFRGHSISSSYFVNDHEGPTRKIMWETLTVAFSMISEVYSGTASCLSVGVWQSTVEVLSMFMDIFASKSLLVEDEIISILYIEIFNCLHLALANPRGSLSAHVAGFVAALKIFFSYGHVNKAFAGNQPTNHLDFGSKSTNSHLDVPSKSLHGPYRPPHLRKKSLKNLQHENSINSSEDNSSEPYCASSDSDCNDKGGSAKDSCYSVFAKARLGAIICIQDLCRADPKSFTGQWAMLLPSSDVFHRKYETTLMSCLLFDPYLKVRISAGSTIIAMLDGPASVSLQLAEYKGPSKCGSFTALSCSLGSILMQLHSGTLHLIKHETHSRLLELSFKIMMLLLSSTPYSRMSEELLWTIISSVHSRIVEVVPFQSDISCLLELAISCLTKALSVSPSSMHVNNILQVEMSTGILEGQHKSGILYTLFRYSGQLSDPSISLEAFQALKALAHNYPEVTALCWKDISTIVYGVLCLHPEVSTKWSNVDQTVSAMKEKVMTASVKVLDECLRAISGFKGAEDLTNDKFMDNPFTSDYVKTKTISSAPSYSVESTMPVHDECKMFCLASDRWLEVLVKHMPLIIKHTSPVIRAASVMCFAGITSTVFFNLSEDKQDFITSSSIDAATRGAPVVRSVACRAIGVIACFSQIYDKRTEILGKFIHAIQHNARDPLISVRITASWALANICDSLSYFMNAPNVGRAGEGSEIISLLADCALQLTKDNDKVKANAVRALGNLSRFVPFTSQPFVHGEPKDHKCSKVETNGTKPSNDHLQSWSEPSGHSEWLGKMVQTFLSCLTTGNVKVQWNVCHALRNLFCNKTLKLQDKDWASSIFSILLLLLRDSSNFKIRIQAAAALAVPGNIDDYSTSYYDVIKGVMHIVENFNSNQISDPSNFKYWIALEKQLTSTLLHLLGLAARCDQQTVQELLAKKASFLEAWIKGLCLPLGCNPGEQEKTTSSAEQKKEILSKAIQSMIQVYERGNYYPIAQRFHRLSNTFL